MLITIIAMSFTVVSMPENSNITVLFQAVFQNSSIQLLICWIF